MFQKSFNIEAALLFGSPFKPIVFEQFRNALNTALASKGFKVAFQPTRATNPSILVLTHPDIHICLTTEKAPLAGDTLMAALASNFIKMKPADYLGLVAEHTSNICVSVGDGPAPNATDKTEAPDDMDFGAPLQTKIAVLHRAILEVMKVARPTIVHWRQSDQLLLPEEIEQTAKAKFPTPLLTHPNLFSSGNDPQGHRKIGFRADGSQLFVGKPLVMAESHHDITTKLNIVDYLIVQFLAGKLALKDGDIYQFSEETQLRIVHLKSNKRFPSGKIAILMEPEGSHVKAPKLMVNVKKRPQTVLLPKAVNPACVEIAAGHNTIANRLNCLWSRLSYRPSFWFIASVSATFLSTLLAGALILTGLAAMTTNARKGSFDDPLPDGA